MARKLDGWVIFGYGLSVASFSVFMLGSVDMITKSKELGPAADIWIMIISGTLFGVSILGRTCSTPMFPSIFESPVRINVAVNIQESEHSPLLV